MQYAIRTNGYEHNGTLLDDSARRLNYADFAAAWADGWHASEVIMAANDATYHGEAHHPAWAPFFNAPAVPDYASTDALQAYRWHLLTITTNDAARAEALVRDHEKSYGVPGIANSRLSPLSIARYRLACQHARNIERAFQGICGITHINYATWEVSDINETGYTLP